MTFFDVPIALVRLIVCLDQTVVEGNYRLFC